LEKQEYLKVLSQLLNIEEKSLILDFEKFKKHKKNISKKSETNTIKKQQIDQQQYLV